MEEKDLKNIVNFIYETGILSKTPRSGLWFLGTGSQSVAEHILRTVFIGYALSQMVPEANKERVMFLCLVHDLGEGRTSDLNYVHQKYGKMAESQAISDICGKLPFGEEIEGAYREMEERESLEARLAKEADNLEWLATMREEELKGNSKAKSWADIVFKRLKTEAGQKLGKLLLSTHPDDWWFDENDRWFVDRDSKKDEK